MSCQSSGRERRTARDRSTLSSLVGVALTVYVYVHGCEVLHACVCVCAGHVDAGKSTLMGHLLYLLGNVSKKAMHK